MNHCGTKTIETKRLLLRAFRLSDVTAAYYNWTSDEKVTEFLRWPTHSDISITEQVIKSWVEQSDEPDFYQWAIVLKEINEPINPQLELIIKDINYILDNFPFDEFIHIQNNNQLKS